MIRVAECPLSKYCISLLMRKFGALFSSNYLVFRRAALLVCNMVCHLTTHFLQCLSCPYYDLRQPFHVSLLPSLAHFARLVGCIHHVKLTCLWTENKGYRFGVIKEYDRLRFRRTQWYLRAQYPYMYMTCLLYTSFECQIFIF